jgi:hypothetical protein
MPEVFSFQGGICMSQTMDQVVELARGLTPFEKARLIGRLILDVEVELRQADNLRPRKSAYGISRDAGPSPSAEEIDEVRKEVFREFPRGDG